MLLAARIREAFGLPGHDRRADRAVPRQGGDEAVLDAAGIRTPWHVRATTRRAESGRPPSRSATRSSSSRSPAPARPTPTASTRPSELAEVLPMLRHVPEVSVEEFVDGEEFTYDTVCADGQDPVRARAAGTARGRCRCACTSGSARWRSPCATWTCPHLQGGREMGRQVLAALGFETGFTHMEWYRKADGEVVFGEIGARPPGARVVDMMNFATDGDLYVGWAEAVVHGRMPAAGAPVQRGQHLQARTWLRPDHRHRRAGRAAGGVRSTRGARRPAPGRCAPARLARQH